MTEEELVDKIDELIDQVNQIYYNNNLLVAGNLGNRHIGHVIGTTGNATESVVREMARNNRFRLIILLAADAYLKSEDDIKEIIEKTKREIVNACNVENNKITVE